MGHYKIWKMYTDVSEECATSIFTLKMEAE
jgi:hypothetical protein